MHYVTREHVHVDRIATAWALRRFVDPEATFAFVPRGTEVSAAQGITFDLRGADIGHRRGRCTFDAVVERYELTDPALHRMAAIIRGADLPREETSPVEAPGILAIFTGIRDGSSNDEERMERGFVVCEALYSYCTTTRDAGTAP